MVLVYRGNVKRLSEEVDRNKDRVNQRCAEVFGERFDKLAWEVERVITPESFFSSAEDYRRFCGFNGPVFADGIKCKILFGTDLNYAKNADGRLKASACKAAYGFYVPGDADISTESLFRSYISQYCKFLLALTQRTPSFLGLAALNEGTTYFENPHNFLLEYVPRIKRSKMDLEEKGRILLMKSVSLAISDFIERSSGILENLVLEGSGNSWRGQEKDYYKFQIPKVPIEFILPKSGDPFRQMTDQQAIEWMADWQDHLSEKTAIGYLKNIYDSLAKFDVEICSFKELTAAR